MIQPAVGYLLGPMVPKIIPTRGRLPDLFQAREIEGLLRPNTLRLFRQAGLASLLEFLAGLATETPELEAKTVNAKK